ncbi:MAG: NADH-quinone oxidoreductase subunit M [Acidobacteria bacterium]|nr:MAG: NADH-quinone oxidoreductase subunit M [Acidobacteriota bacterium]PYV39070.1 MAG: NADH-quinone oxidoreductase subunit M [Acidobacteriota bacterium]
MRHILNIVCYLPLLGVALIVFVKPERKTAVKWVANITAFLGFLVSIPLITSFNDPQYIDSSTGFRYVFEVNWIPLIGAKYKFGIDGISLLLVLLTTLLGFIAILSSWNAVTERVKEYYAFLLLLQTGMLGVFMALDFLLFYVFWEVMLVPMYFLIGVWGGPRKLYAAIKFFLYTLAGSVLMLVGILAIYFYQYNTTGIYSFDILALQKLGFPHDLQYWVFLAFFVGFAIKVPMFPFHTWLPDAHVEAPTAGSVILAGVLLKMGTYGFVRFSLPMLPWATMHFLKPMLILSLIGIIYGALVAMMQKDMKSLVAYSSVSHLGFVMLGVFAATPVALQGAVLQMVNHGISTGALFLIVGVIYERRHSRLITEYGGLSQVMPVYATVFLIMTLSSIGMPGLNGFIGELFILQGTFAAPGLWMYAAVAVLGIVLGAAYMLWLYQRVMFGKLENPLNQNLPDLNFRELATFVPLIILAFWIGIYPSYFTRFLDQPVNAIVERVRTDYFKAGRAEGPLPASPVIHAIRAAP